MFRIIFILLGEQIKYFFRKEQLWIRLLVAFFVSIISLIYSIGLGFGLKVGGKAISEEFGLTIPQLIMVIIGLVGATNILSHFFPTYRPKKKWIPVIFPMSGFQRFTIEVVVDFLNLLYLGSIFFFIVPFFMAEAFTWQLMLLVVFYNLFVLLALRAFQTLFQEQINWSNFKAYAGIATILIGVLTIIPTAIDFETYWWLSFITFYLGKIGAFLIEITAVGKKEEQASVGQLEYNSIQLGRALMWNNKKLRTSLLVSFVLKVLFLIFLSVQSRFVPSQQDFMHGYLMFFALPPITLFTYIFNNLFGYLRETWLTIQKTTASFKDLFTIYSSILIIPLLVDFMISLVYAIYQKVDLVFFLGMYIGCVIFNFIGGLLWSIYFPRPVVKKGINLKGGQTSPISSFAIMGSTLLLFTIKLSHWFLLLIPLYILAAWLMYIAMRDDYKNKHYQLYEKLFKKS
ncbi:MAG: hypothetical protein CL843_02970 [Crocinitomicaceae bacterium]|nr:hypothetical protein [Crocinitomicaceae bacterium]|tara:strand:- start:6880 stop:8250 length:1371 start_codon:yes stop_codon:yes gene_type:complete